MGRKRGTFLTSLGLLAWFAAAAFSQPAEKRVSGSELKAIRAYIKQGWRTLARSNAGLAEAAVDPKFRPAASGRWPVYVSRKENIRNIAESLRAQLKPKDLERLELRHLPADLADLRDHGLLYLPHPYVVPGGRFNEMYGWDSYFIQVGLLRDGELEMAKNMVDNFVYQVEQYGKVLNANRTYYLTRSQPPFLTRMVLGVYRATGDRLWLSMCVPAIEKYYRYWIDPLHMSRETRLSRYYDTGGGPAPEVVSSERDESGRTHYDRVREYYRTREVKDYDLGQFYNSGEDRLTELFYIGDRSMRESGFDPSNRFGPFNVDIVHYNPVCLNSLLYAYESDMAEIMKTLAHMSEATLWQERAELRKRRINELMWDERDGLYYDYNFYKREVRRYPFVTTFYPLWAGVADQRQAARVVGNLRLFERRGGLVTSTNESGSQWDSPWGWAPMQMIADEGLRRYGYREEADRAAANFLSMVLKEFVEHAGIVEKYDVVRRESQVGDKIKFGYSSNEIGFGWTNAAFTELYHHMSGRAKSDVLKLDGAPVPQR